LGCGCSWLWRLWRRRQGSEAARQAGSAAPPAGGSQLAPKHKQSTPFGFDKLCSPQVDLALLPQTHEFVQGGGAQQKRREPAQQPHHTTTHCGLGLHAGMNFLARRQLLLPWRGRGENWREASQRACCSILRPHAPPHSFGTYQSVCSRPGMAQKPCPSARGAAIPPLVRGIQDLTADTGCRADSSLHSCSVLQEPWTGATAWRLDGGNTPKDRWVPQGQTAPFPWPSGMILPLAQRSSVIGLLLSKLVGHGAFAFADLSRKASLCPAAERGRLGAWREPF
jgi:hypothetical protein